MGSFKRYAIEAGKHHCKRRFPAFFFGRTLRFQVIFNESAIYETAKRENRYDINKLFGFTDGLFIHKNSARFGWNWIDGKLYLYVYAYTNGERISKELFSVPLGVIVECAISIDGPDYRFFAFYNGEDGEAAISNIPRATRGKNRFGFICFPYFGGDETAPSDISIQIKRING